MEEFVCAVVAVLIGLMVPVAGLGWILRLSGRIESMARDLDRLRREVTALRSARSSLASVRGAASGSRRTVDDASAVEEPSQAVVPDEPPPREDASTAEPVSPLGPSEPVPEAAPEEAPAPATSTPAPSRRPLPEVPAPSLSPERMLVWVGGGLGALFALLFVVFLLKLAIDAGLLGPPVRVGTGLLVGLGLWGLGAATRARTPFLGSALSAAGLAALYGALFAGSTLYTLWPAAVGFGGMILVTAGGFTHAVVRKDRVMAHFATVGGLLTPMLLPDTDSHPSILVVYLAALTAGAVGAGARLRWWAVVGEVVLGAGILHLGTQSARAWKGVPADTVGVPDWAVWGAIGAFALAVPPAVVAWKARDDDGGRRLGAMAAVLAAAVPITGLGITAFEPWPAALLALVGIGIGLVLAWRRDEPWPAAASSVLALVLTAYALFASDEGDSTGVELVLLAVGPLALAALAGWRRERAGLGAEALPVAATAAIVGSGVMAEADLGLVASLGVLVASLGAWWGGTGARVLVASACALPAALVLQQDEGASAALTLGVIGLGPVLGAWPALLAPETHRLRWTWWGAPVVALLAVGMAWAPWQDLFGDGHGFLTLVVGAHTLALAVVLERRGAVTQEGALYGVLLLVGLGLVTATLPLELEQAALTVSLGVEAAVLALVTRGAANRVVAAGSIAVAVAVGIRLLANPAALAYGDATGMVLLNWTLYTWGVPAVALGLGAWALANGRLGQLAWVRTGAALQLVLALLVGFALVNVEVSHAFQDVGPLSLLDDGLTPSMVRSVSWGLYGVLLVAGGLRLPTRIVRSLGFVFVLLGALKVLLVDLFQLGGGIRVASIGGAAVTLLVATFLFERVVLRRPDDAGD